MIPLKNACAKVNITDLIFCPLTYNGRLQKWPDLRSPISKIQDIRFVGTDDLIIFRKFHNFPWNIVAVARWESYFVVGSLDLTWWPDLTWPWAEISQKLRKRWGVRWWKPGGAARRRFSLSSKNLRGGRSNAPPQQARVNVTWRPDLTWPGAKIFFCPDSTGGVLVFFFNLQHFINFIKFHCGKINRQDGAAGG